MDTTRQLWPSVIRTMSKPVSDLCDTGSLPTLETKPPTNPSVPGLLAMNPAILAYTSSQYGSSPQSSYRLHIACLLLTWSFFPMTWYIKMPSLAVDEYSLHRVHRDSP